MDFKGKLSCAAVCKKIPFFLGRQKFNGSAKNRNELASWRTTQKNNKKMATETKSHFDFESPIDVIPFINLNGREHFSQLLRDKFKEMFGEELEMKEKTGNYKVRFHLSFEQRFDIRIFNAVETLRIEKKQRIKLENQKKEENGEKVTVSNRRDFLADDDFLNCWEIVYVPKYLKQYITIHYNDEYCTESVLIDYCKAFEDILERMDEDIGSTKEEFKYVKHIRKEMKKLWTERKEQEMDFAFSTSIYFSRPIKNTSS